MSPAKRPRPCTPDATAFFLLDSSSSSLDIPVFYGDDAVVVFG